MWTSISFDIALLQDRADVSIQQRTTYIKILYYIKEKQIIVSRYLQTHLNRMLYDLEFTESENYVFSISKQQ